MRLIDKAIVIQHEAHDIFNREGVGGELLSVLLNRHEWTDLNTGLDMEAQAAALGKQLADAPLYAVTREMNAVVVAGARNLEADDTCEPLDMDWLPSQSGMVVLDEPYSMRVASVDYETRPVHGFFWVPTRVGHHDPITDEWAQTGGIMSGVMLRKENVWESDYEDIIWDFVPHDVTAWGKGLPWYVVPAEDWGPETIRIRGACHPAGAEWRRWLTAFWNLAQQRLPHTTTQLPGRGFRRRFERDTEVLHGGVRVLTLRRYSESGGEKDESGYAYDYDHRWVVNGHWRRQPYGPGRSKFKMIWIDSYVKGPDGKPLVLRKDVQVLRR